MIRPEQVASTPLFSELSSAIIEQLCQGSLLMPVETGAAVIREGDAPTDMYVVLAGELEVLKASDKGTEVRVALLGPGDWFGEAAMMDKKPRSATVRSVAPSRLMRIDVEFFNEVLTTDDPKAYGIVMRNIAKELGRRLRIADKVMAQVVGRISDEYIRARLRNTQH